ncbi:unnamed protein product, partial [Didymodactylos carnosus]
VQQEPSFSYLTGKTNLLVGNRLNDLACCLRNAFGGYGRIVAVELTRQENYVSFIIRYFEANAAEEALEIIKGIGGFGGCHSLKANELSTET